MSGSIKEFFISKRDEINRKFKRVLSAGEYLSDRWEKAEYLGFGEKSSIYDSSLVFGDVRVGENCWIGPYTILDGSGGLLVIGDNCDISAGVQIYTHDTIGRVIYNSEIETGNVVIGKNCYIGPNTIISRGVTIGSFCIIGANSFVNQDIPSFTKAFGTPARIIGKVDVDNS